MLPRKLCYHYIGTCSSQNRGRQLSHAVVLVASCSYFVFFYRVLHRFFIVVASAIIGNDMVAAQCCAHCGLCGK